MPPSRARRPRNDRPNVFRAINMLDAPSDAPNTDTEKYRGAITDGIAIGSIHGRSSFI